MSDRKLSTCDVATLRVHNIVAGVASQTVSNACYLSLYALYSEMPHIYIYYIDIHAHDVILLLLLANAPILCCSLYKSAPL